eukprot:1295228-Amorphochlora_amoeboformis.AAC.1
MHISISTLQKLGSELDVTATIIGFASGFWKLGIPLGIAMRFLMGPKIFSWSAWMKDDVHAMKLESKS